MENEQLIKEIKEAVIQELKKEYFLVKNIGKSDLFYNERNTAFILLACEIVSEYFQISLEKLISGDRKRTYLDPRRIVVMMCRNICKPSIPYERIGDTFNKDHSSVIHSFKIATELIEVDNKFRSDYNKLKEEIKSKYFI